MSAVMEGRIGPNAIIQTTAALRDRVGDQRAGKLLLAATGRALDAMPELMVDEHEVNRFVRALREELEEPLFEAVLRDAGVRTAEYLIAHRIPWIAQQLMRILPASVALRILLGGIMRHTWTFAGTAHVSVLRRSASALSLVMQHCPMCRGLSAKAPTCHFYAATLETLLVRLVTPCARVIEVRCEAAGGSDCEFALVIE